MNLKDFKLNLQKVKDSNEKFTFSLWDKAGKETFEQVEKALGISISDKTKEFYRFHNGFKTHQPDFELLRLENWSILENDKIHFATFDKDLKVYFDTKELNQADSWSIINPQDNYVLTLTMSSFWSNKIWHWLKTERQIWKDEFWKE
ncbi:hypothetical protein BZG02_06840 [Labilibaculum filiforme]|uniref:Knr4/Smi1-like domain-containing protein n=1 Tax=Labilibaculum filiforme TaxID=1940526 RepID=A0A2N3I2I5_9BACT|nr:hypothetical protein [Labilibaculum filiforme]PKQ64514.1 hypothetical protein BZG02_06840 [Labilibaculum filiforme]